MGDARILEMSGAFKVGKCPNQVRARGRADVDAIAPDRLASMQRARVARARRASASTRGPENQDDTESQTDDE